MTSISWPVSLKPYSPEMISRTFAAVRTMEQALATHQPTLLGLARAEGCNREQVKALMMAHLVELDAFLKQKKGLTKAEIIMITEEVMERYGGMLNFADIHVIFRKAKLGDYGELYESLSCSKVMKWFDEYADERMNVAYEMNRQKDREMYSGKSGSGKQTVLDKLGYSINKDGTISLAPKKENQDVERNAPQRTSEKNKSQAEKEEEYRKWKMEWIRSHHK